MELIVSENETHGKNINEVESTALVGIKMDNVKYIVVYFSETDTYGLMNSMLSVDIESYWHNNDLLISHYISQNHKAYYFENRIEHLTWLVT